MSSDFLTPEQVKRLRDDTWRDLQHYEKLLKRVEGLNWPMHDPVRRNVKEVRDALVKLFAAARGAGGGTPY